MFTYKTSLPFLHEEAPSNMEVQSLMVLQKLRMDPIDLDNAVGGDKRSESEVCET